MLDTPGRRFELATYNRMDCLNLLLVRCRGVAGVGKVKLFNRHEKRLEKARIKVKAAQVQARLEVQLKTIAGITLLTDGVCWGCRRKMLKGESAGVIVTSHMNYPIMLFYCMECCGVNE